MLVSFVGSFKQKVSLIKNYATVKYGGDLMKIVPKTNNQWVEKISKTLSKDRLDLIIDRPIIAWFSEEKISIQRLIKLSGCLGNDSWMIQGRGNQENKDFDMTIAPTTLDKCLRWPSRDCGWVLCEFPDERSFYEAALEYLK